MDRRRFLRATGAAGFATTLGLAGCSGGGSETTDGDGGSDSTGSGKRAPYADWLYKGAYDTSNGQGILGVSLRPSTLSDSGADSGGDTNTKDLPDDPLLGLTVSYVFVGAFSFGFGLANSGLQSYVETDGPTEWGNVVSGGITLDGSYDTAAVGDSITGAGGSEAGSDGDYTLYESSGSSTRTTGVSSDAIVTASEGENVDNATDRVKSIIDTQTGDKTLYADENDAFASLASSLPRRDIMAIQFTPEKNLFELDGSDSGGSSSGSQMASPADLGLTGTARGAAVSATIDTESQSLTTSLAIKYASAGETDDKSTIESALGTAATDQSVTVDGDLVVIEGTYDESIMGGQSQS